MLYEMILVGIFLATIIICEDRLQNGKTFANHISDKELIYEVYKEPIQLNSKKFQLKK